MLALLGAEQDDEGESAFRKFGDLRAGKLAPAPPPLGGFLRFPFGHNGGDCTPNGRNGKENPELYLSAFLRPAFRLSKLSRVLSTRE